MAYGENKIVRVIRGRRPKIVLAEEQVYLLF